MGSLNFSGCGFSLITLGYGRSGLMYVQSKVSVVGNQGTHFTGCSSKNPHLQGLSHPLTQVEVS